MQYWTVYANLAVPLRGTMKSVFCHSNNKKTLRLKVGLFLFLAVCGTALFCSCNQKSSAISFPLAMDEADNYIKAGKIKEADAVLKSVSKNASSVAEYLSLYKRFVRMNNNSDAEKIIKKAYSKYSDKAEIEAIYAHFLLNHNQLEQALKIAKNLEGTRYGSILTEIKLRQAKIDNDYLKREFVTSFTDAAYATGNDAYLRNAAIIEAYNGFIDAAMALHPVVPMHNENKYFWATISYDAGNYTQTYIDLSSMEDTAEIMLLRADAALYLGEQETAYSMWQKSLELDKQFSPIPYYNLALFAQNAGNFGERGKNLVTLVKYFPLYVPGLSSYGKYAFETMHTPSEDSITKAVRNAGFKSLRMEELDDFPIVPVEDAVARMNVAIEENPKSALLIERSKLEWKNSEKKNDEKLIDVWLLLEQYPNNDELNNYAVWLLCVLHRYNEAKSLFDKNLKMKYGSSDYKQNAKLMSEAECEFAAFLSTIKVPNEEFQNYELALSFYKMLLDRKVQNVSVLMNYGSIQQALNNYNTAMDSYNQALRLSPDTKIKAELQYRMGNIYTAQKDYKNAMLCLSYALALNPDHANARLLYKRLEGF